MSAGFCVKMGSAPLGDMKELGLLGSMVRKRLLLLKKKLERQLSGCLFRFVLLSEINKSFCSFQCLIQRHDCLGQCEQMDILPR